MKHSLIFGSIALLAPAVAQAQPQQFSQQVTPPALMPAAPRAITPALDAFAYVGRQLQLKARWVQIDAVALAKNLPDWDKPGASSHAAALGELKALEVLRATGVASVTEQRINATNNQIANLSFPLSSFTFIKQPALAPRGPIDDMVIPHDTSRFDGPQTDMPNLAKPESRLPEMAPMPGLGSKFDLPFTAPILPSNPYIIPQSSRGTANFLAYKFQLRPNFIGEEIALELRDSNLANSVPLKATVKPGETVVFSIPNVLLALGSGKVRRTFLLVTPTLPASAPALPKP